MQELQVESISKPDNVPKAVRALAKVKTHPPNDEVLVIQAVSYIPTRVGNDYAKSFLYAK